MLVRKTLMAALALGLATPLLAGMQAEKDAAFEITPRVVATTELDGTGQMKLVRAGGGMVALLEEEAAADLVPGRGPAGLVAVFVAEGARETENVVNTPNQNVATPSIEGSRSRN